MVTIKDVALKSGVSICTVSRVLSNKGYIKDSTRQKVMDAVHELGYVQNSTAAELKTGISSTIAIILPDIENMFYSKLATSIESYAYSKGYLLFICNTSYDKEKEDFFLRGMSARNIRGLIGVPVTSDISSYKKYLGNIPYVIFNRNLADDSIACYKIDNFRVGYEVTTHLIENGSKKIVGAFRNFSNGIYLDRFNGMKQALQDHGLVYDESNVIFNIDEESIHERIAKIFGQKERPDAVFASNDMLAFEVYKELQKIGLVIPDDVMIASIDDTSMATKIYPPLTSYRIPVEDFTKVVIDSFIESNFAGGTKILEGELIVRKSTTR